VVADEPEQQRFEQLLLILKPGVECLLRSASLASDIEHRRSAIAVLSEHLERDPSNLLAPIRDGLKA
jgi:hypothetical protein